MVKKEKLGNLEEMKKEHNGEWRRILDRSCLGTTRSGAYKCEGVGCATVLECRAVFHRGGDRKRFETSRFVMIEEDKEEKCHIRGADIGDIFETINTDWKLIESIRLIGAGKAVFRPMYEHRENEEKRRVIETK